MNYIFLYTIIAVMLIIGGFIAFEGKFKDLFEGVKPKRPINSYDVDGVIFLGRDIKSIKPDHDDIIITGRSFEERKETEQMLKDLKIKNHVFYNPLPFDQKSRTTSGQHKASILTTLHDRGNTPLHDRGYDVQCHWEDDPVQAEVIRLECPWIHVILVTSDLIEKENVRRPWDGLTGPTGAVGVECPGISGPQGLQDPHAYWSTRFIKAPDADQ